MIRVGDHVTRRVTFMERMPNGQYISTTEAMPAEVVWIHPQQRFYTIRVALPGGRNFLTTEYFYPRQAG